MATETALFPILNTPVVSVDFQDALRQHGLTLRRQETRTLQINVGKLCNQACHHCHVDAGPKRTEIMSAAVADRCIGLLVNSPSITTIDITGGAPELNANFRRLVIASRWLGKRVIDRCNLTVFFVEGQKDLPKFLAENNVSIVASLPCYTADNVDKQRGRGVFEKSIRGLHILNGLGYGKPDSERQLDLVYNPLGAFLPPSQEKLEADYKKQLREHFGIEFHRLLTITNMPIRRFAEQLVRESKYDSYMSLLVNHFNPATVDGLMCRSLVSVSWQGKLYDCDFNQMVEMPMPGFESRDAPTIWDVDTLSGLARRKIATGSHCFGCTAGAGSSCGGSLQ